MFKLLEIMRVYGSDPLHPEGTSQRVWIQADNTTDPLPTTGSQVEGMDENVLIEYGSIAQTPQADVCLMGNNREWGDWI